MFRTIILMAWLAVPIGPASAEDTLRDKLTEAMKEYCVPPDEQSCSGDMLARYRNNSCDCGDPLYMRYSRELRKCEVVCPAGQIPEEVVEGGCGAGYGQEVVKDF